MHCRNKCYWAKYVMFQHIGALCILMRWCKTPTLHSTQTCLKSGALDVNLVPLASRAIVDWSGRLCLRCLLRYRALYKECTSERTFNLPQSSFSYDKWAILKLQGVQRLELDGRCTAWMLKSIISPDSGRHITSPALQQNYLVVIYSKYILTSEWQ